MGTCSPQKERASIFLTDVSKEGRSRGLGEAAKASNAKNSIVARIRKIVFFIYAFNFLNSKSFEYLYISLSLCLTRVHEVYYLFYRRIRIILPLKMFFGLLNLIDVAEN